MASPTEIVTTPGTPKQEEPASQFYASIHHAISVRSDVWDAILKFINAQDVVVSAAVPRHLYPIQAIAKDQLKPLKNIIDKYKHLDDQVEVQVEFEGGARQKTRFSKKALFPGEVLKVAKGIQDEQKPINAEVSGVTRPENNGADSKIVDGIRVGKIAHQSKMGIQNGISDHDTICRPVSKNGDKYTVDQKRVKPSPAATKKEFTSNTTKSTTMRFPQKGAALNTRPPKLTTPQQATANSLRNTFQNAAGKIKTRPTGSVRPSSAKYTSPSLTASPNSTAPTRPKGATTTKDNTSRAAQKISMSETTAKNPTAVPTTTAKRSSIFSSILEEVKVPIPFHKHDPVAYALARQPKVAARQTSKETNVSKGTDASAHATLTGHTKVADVSQSNVTKQQTLKFIANGDDYFVRSGTPPKANDPVPTRLSHSEALTSTVRAGSTVTTISSTHTPLKDKTNKSKPAAAFESASNTNKVLQPAKSATKRKRITAEDNIGAVSEAAEATSKRQRVTKEVGSTECSANDQTTKSTSTKDIKGTELEPAFGSNLNALVDVSPPSVGVDKVSTAPSPVDVDGTLGQDHNTGAPHELGANMSYQGVEKAKTDATAKPTTTSSRETVGIPEFDLAAPGIVKKLSKFTPDTSGELGEKKGVPKIVNKARKSRKVSAGPRHDSIDNEDTKPKKKANKAKNPGGRNPKAQEDIKSFRDDNEDTDNLSPKPRTAIKSKHITNSLTKNAGVQKSRSTMAADNGRKFKNERSKGKLDDLHQLIQENLNSGLILHEPRRKPAASHPHPSFPTSLPSPSSVPSSPSPTGSKRSHTLSVEENKPTKKSKKSVEKVESAEEVKPTRKAHKIATPTLRNPNK
ncbi:hypothetical protein M3J09_003607 [Ascochyta lentis]